MTRCIVWCLLSVVTLAQSRTEFEVASIRPSSEQITQISVGLRVTGSEVRVTYMSLKDYIGMAYNMRPNQIVGPDWLAQQRFDVAAKIPSDGSPTKLPEMLQALLADRFQLKVHREKREFPVYALLVAKSGLKIKEAPPAPETPGDKPAPVAVSGTGTGGGVAVDLGGGSSFTFGNNRLDVRKMTLSDFAEVLTRFVDRPVLDMTEVKGRYDLTLEMLPEDYTTTMIRSAINQGVALPPQAVRMLDNASPDPFSSPLQQAGLTLERRRAPLDVIVVDSALKTPTEN